ncbi:carboxypeptidase regulatory-like domain-containing protein [Algoriphagus sp. SE2]|uniref:carboxypeptidase regulatory-like domain-containing protein n=1 Tax=Algoriphagus sp. SE2 TaxID=3141536 RepID=UPI0031CD8E5F
MSRNPYFFFFAFLLIITFIFSLSNSARTQSLNFTGSVKDELSGAGLKDIHLFVPNTTFQTFTDSLGRFSFPSIPPGRWELVIIGNGFETIQETIELVKNKSNNQDFILSLKQSIFPLGLNLSEKKREKLVLEFSESFLAESRSANNIRLLNPQALIFSEKDNSKQIQVDAQEYLIFVNDQTGFLFTLYLLEPYLIETPVSKDKIHLAFLDLINDNPELFADRTAERERIFINSPEFILRQMLSGEITSTNLSKPINVAFSTFPGEFVLSFPRPYSVEGKGKISYTGDELVLRSEGSVVFEDQLILDGGYSETHPLDQLPSNLNAEKVLRLANIEKSAQVLQEKVFFQTDRRHYLKGETLFFKANMIYANPLLSPELSKVLHIEILNTTGYQEYHQVFQIKAGKAMGSIYLPVDLNQENYFIKAYTTWSLNYGNPTFLPIQIHDPSLKPVHALPEQKSKGVSIFSDKQNYGSDEVVNLNIMVKDANGRPIASDLAIRVLDMNEAMPIESIDSINEEFVLNPVPDTTDYKNFKYPLENRFSLEGEIKNQENKPIDGDVTALINGLENIEKYKVEKDGIFGIPNLSFEGDFEIAIQAKSKDGLPVRNISLKIQDYQSSETIPSFEFPKLSDTKVAPLTAMEIQENMEQGEILLDEFVVDEEKSDPVGPMIYGSPDVSVKPEDLPLNGSTSQFIYLLSGQVAGMSVTGNPPSIRFRNGGEPLVMIDGVPINPPSGSMLGGGSTSSRTATEVIAGINVFAIERVEIIKRTVSMLGEGGRNGIISIFMKSGADLEKANQAMMNNFTPFKLSGFPASRKFTDVIGEQKLNPLLRGLKPTLYWNPEVITNTEELSQKIQFKSSISGGPMWVEIKGISADGQPLEGRFVINQE